VSTASRATIGGMSGNNSCGARSIHYGIMRDNVLAIDAYLADGTKQNFGPVQANVASNGPPDRYQELVADLTLLAEQESGEIQSKFPALRRRVGGYNIDELLPRTSPEVAPANMARLLVGSEGTLAISTQITLGLHRIPSHRVLAVCHFDSFYEAMDSTRHIVTLNPTAVELVDKTMIELSRDIPMFRKTIDQFVRGTPDALLLVEFAGEDHQRLLLDLKHLEELMADYGFRSRMTAIVDPTQQRALWEVRKAGLNIMMSMKGDGKPISFIEDCAVPLEHLADYTARLTEVFSKHGTTGTWYAHASEGCLHVRPVLNMKDSKDVRKMRAIAEEAFAMVREYKGSHSGEHGDGIVRSEFHPVMFGDRMIRSFESVKRMFDPTGLLNPGKIVDPQKMDDRSLFRYQPHYHTGTPDTELDWSEWGGIAGAIEMCNNNGACRKRDASVMCPSYRATSDEAHVTRGRANTLRLAISGQLGPDALSSDEVAKSMSLCVGCKACKRECPTGVDMARMKIEVNALRAKTHKPGLRDRIIGFLPRYAYYARFTSWALQILDRIPGIPWLREKVIGISRHRRLPRFLSDSALLGEQVFGPAQGKAVLLLVDTFTYWFEPDNAKDAIEVLIAHGYQVHLPKS
ncbi:MAG: FAD-linked oxidase C-terminal domain-containing protein, partial [Pseudomonadota bacterium]